MSKTKLLTAIITILLASLSTLAQKKSFVIDVPMSFYGNRPAIEVVVNGKGPFLFLVDTGAQGMARADASLVKELGLAISGQTTTTDSSAKAQASINEVRFQSLSIGSLKFQDVPALSRNYNTASYLVHIDGILGLELFANYLLTLDYPNKRVRLTQGELPKANGTQVLDFELIEGNIYTQIAIGNLKVKAEIDTGNIRAIDLPSSLLRKIPLASYPRLVGRGSGASGDFELKEVRLQDALKIGAYSFHDPVVTFTDFYEEVNVGSGLLREFVVTIDQKNHRIRLIKTRGAAKMRAVKKTGQLKGLGRKRLTQFFQPRFYERRSVK
jgi:hypothetical protein